MIPNTLEALLRELNTDQIAHTGWTLYDHLVGTYSLLKSWDNPEEVCIAGLFHSIYGTQFYQSRSVSLEQRKHLRDSIGTRAEELVYLFCVSERADFWKDSKTDDTTLTNHVDGKQCVVSNTTRRALLELEVANTIEQVRRGFGSNDFVEKFRIKVNTSRDQLSPKARSAIQDLCSQTSLRSADNGLTALLAPVHPEVFVNEFFGKKPLYIKGNQAKFSWLFSFERLRKMLAESTDLTVRASFDGGRSQIKVLPSEAMTLFRAGATICVNNATAGDEGLSKFAASVRRQLGFAGLADFRAYLSPIGQGYDIHFDSRIATTIQLEGKKLWRFSRESALPWPHYQVRSGEDDTLVTDYTFQEPPQAWERYRCPSECTFEEVLLEPGDVLCLPAGSWHSAQAQDCSVSLNLAFEPSNFWDLLVPVLQSAIKRRAEWRQPLPCVVSHSAYCGALPAGVETFFKDRIRELIGILGALAQDPVELSGAWHRAIVFGNEPITSPSSAVATGRSIDQDDRLRLTQRGTVAYGFGASPSGEKVLCVYGTNPAFEIGYSAHAAPFFRNLLAQREFSAGSAMGWTDDGTEYSWKNVQSILEDLITHGVLEITI